MCSAFPEVRLFLGAIASFGTSAAVVISAADISAALVIAPGTVSAALIIAASVVVRLLTGWLRVLDRCVAASARAVSAGAVSTAV